MDSFSAYANAARSTAFYPGSDKPFTPDVTALSYLALGAAGESGEVADKVKKLIRDGNGELTEDRRVALLEEVGDALWYLALLSGHLGSSIGEVAARNVAKLRSRHDRGTLSGSGDAR